MGTVIGILVLIGIGIVGLWISNTRTKARKGSNSAVRQSLNVSSSRSVDEVRAAIAHGLVTAGLTEIGEFDNSQFFKINTALQLELKVWPDEGRTLAKLTVPAVRSVSGRPVKLTPVGLAIAAAAQSVQRMDPQVHIS